MPALAPRHQVAPLAILWRVHSYDYKAGIAEPREAGRADTAVVACPQAAALGQRVEDYQLD